MTNSWAMASYNYDHYRDCRNCRGYLQPQLLRERLVGDKHSSPKLYPHLDYATAESPLSDSVGESERSLSYGNWDNLSTWQSILTDKLDHFEDMARNPNPSAGSQMSSAKLPAKASNSWLTQVLYPRLTSLKDGTDHSVLPMLERWLQAWDSKAEVDHLVIAFDTIQLVEDVIYHQRVKSSEVTWERQVFCKYFLLEGQLRSNRQTQARAVHQFIQPQLKYHDHLIIPPPHDQQTSDKRRSKLLIDKIWDIPLSQSFTKGERDGGFFKPDHVYVCRLSGEDREYWNDFIPLTAFRASAELDTL